MLDTHWCEQQTRKNESIKWRRLVDWFFGTSSKPNIINKYRKKPVVIEAFQMTKERRWDNKDWPWWLNEAWQKEPGEGSVWISSDAPIAPGHESAAEIVCGTLEGVHQINWGDWIIQGVKGELYPCKPDIFKMTYEKV